MPNINRNQLISDNDQRKLRLLVAPLDWGLGHASRCIPVIYELLARDIDVWLAGEGHQESMLRQEFPQLPFLDLPGYNVKYTRHQSLLLPYLLLQLPRLRSIIRHEQDWLRTMTVKHGFNAIISDNRYGLHHKKIPSILITHQLQIQTASGNRIDRLVQSMIYRYINRFTECWIPDLATDDNLSGRLGHAATPPKPAIRFIGPLSRLHHEPSPVKPGHLFIALSGPEPQRTQLEHILVEQISHYPGTATIVRGLPGNDRFIPSTNDIQFFNHLPTEGFAREMQRAEYVIARSGYSTIMDIAKLGKHSILIPTPGQTEQQYLATHLLQRGLAYSLPQAQFSLTAALAAAKSFSYRPFPSITDHALDTAVSSLIDNIHARKTTS